MLFSRTYKYQSSLGADAIKAKLLGKHLKIHNMDFEVSEKEQMVKIIPHAEDVEKVKTLPITHVEFIGSGSSSQVKITSKMRKIDKGGPMLIVMFCVFMLLMALFFFSMGTAEYQRYGLWLSGISVVVFALFWMRMESGYFDYVRKIRDYIKKESGL